MDKSKSRTDLLAAGRKKLQQFRQKKDAKGSGSSSHGKSSTKHGKVEKHDARADSVSSDDRSSESSHLIGDEMEQQHGDSSVGHVDSSVSLPIDDATPEIDGNKANESSVLLRQETHVPRYNAAFQPDLPVDGGDLGSHKLTTTEALVSQEDTDAKSLQSELDHPNISLIGTRGDQVVDGSPSVSVLKYELTEEPPRILDVGTASPVIQINANETNSEAEEKGISSRGTSMTLPSEVESLPSNSLLSLSKPIQVIPVKASSHSQDVEVKDSHPIHEKFIQVKEVQLADEGSTHEFEHKTDLPPEPFGILDVDSPAPNEGVSTTEYEVEASNLGHPSASEMFPPEQETSRFISLLPDTEEMIAVTEDIHSLENEAKDKFLQHNFPDLSLILAREDQEAYLPGPEQLVSSIEIEVDEDRKHNEVLSFAGSIPVLDTINKGIPVTTPEVCGEMRKDVITLDDDGTPMLSDIPDIERLVGFQGEAIRQGGHMGLSFDENGSLRLVHLANYLKELKEDEFKLLIKMRNQDVQAISGDADISSEPYHGTADVLDAYKEHIYVANVLKDIFSEQLVEQSKPQFDTDHKRQQWDDKVSKLEISLEACTERNRTLDEELVLCRSELRTTLKNFEELSTAVLEWKDKYIRSEEDLSIVSKDLYECRSLVENLQMEKENLNGSLKSMLDETKQHVEEKDNMFKDNEKLLIEVGELKSQLADVHLRNASLIDNMNSDAENMRKLYDEREYLVQENTVLSSELADCKNLLGDVQAKHTSASESITILTEEKNRLHSQQHNVLLDYEKLTVEMTECKNRLAYLEAENHKLSVNLSSAAEEKKTLKEENRYLLHDNEVLSSEIRAIQEALLSERDEKLNLEAEKRKVNLWLEQLIEESISLHICLEVLECKIRVIDDEECEGANENQHSVNKRDESSFVVDVDPSYNGSSATLYPHDGFTFAILKEHLDTAERAIQNLDKSIEELHTHPSYAQDCGASATGVYKRIQSFKSEKISDDHEEEESVLSVDISSISPLTLVKERSHMLRAVLNQLSLVVGNSKELSTKGTEGRHIYDATNSGTDVQYTALQEHAVYLESYNIELQVQNEALKENLQYIMAKYSETATMNELLQKMQQDLESENNVYAIKLKDCQSRVTKMHNQLLEIKHNLGEIAPSILNKIRNMEIEVARELLWFDNHWNSVVTQIIGFLERLDSFSSGLLASADPPAIQASMEIANRVSTSVDSAISFIKKLQVDYEALKLECQSLDCLYKEVHGSYSNLCKENAASVELLHRIHGSLRSVVTVLGGDETESSLDVEPQGLLDSSQISDYMMLIEQLRKGLHERMQLKFENVKLCSELDNRTKEMEEINKKILDMHVITQLVELAEKQLKLTTLETDSNLPLTSRVENCISSLLQAHKEADGKDNLIEKECESTEKRGGQTQEELQRLIALNIQQENELNSLRLSLSRAGEQLCAVQTELQKKVAEVEQSEQRVSSIREKLSIAVAKGKGLIVQRDNLKQSLAETSNELEKFRHQLQLSDSKLLEAEIKLKTYAEAGERVEALESELSYIRNSATALRESFLLKDSVLQRIEEILEDLELPEHLQSREIIDKVDWLARSVVGNSNTLPATDWDQKNISGGSYTDNGFVVMDAWKDDTQRNLSSSDDLRIKHEELQNKFYGLAEQNEMLEQSLMERNSIVQRLEEVLDKISMPAQFRSLEAASQIEWLGGALSDAVQRASTLQESLDHQKTKCEKLIAELEESQKSFSDIKSVLDLTIKDKENLQSMLTDLTHNIVDIQERATTLELEKNKMQIEIDDLQEKLVKNRDYNDETESGIRKMLDLICTALGDHSIIEIASAGCNILHLEEILRRLIDDHTRLSVAVNIPREIDDGYVEKAISTHDESKESSSSDHDASILKTLEKELEEALGDLTHVREERDNYMKKHKSVSDEIEAVRKRNEELQHLLNQEEQKTASLREKLNVAVRKGKSLVQQRDSLKLTIEEMNIKLDNLASEINNHQCTITQYEVKCRELSSYTEKVQASESENQMLRSRLTETEHYLQEERRTVSLMLDILDGIKVNGGGYNSSDPVEKLQQLGKTYHDLLEAKASSDLESVKSKRAAELLLTELNEVQERNDALQEELARAVDEISELSEANKIIEAARAEALSQLAKFSAAQKDEQKNRNVQLVELKSGVDQLLKYFEDTIHLLADVFSMDMDFFKSLESCLDANDGLFVYSGTFRAKHNDTHEKLFDNGIPAWEKFIASESWLVCKTQEQFNGSDMDDICGYVEHQVRNCVSNISSMKEMLQSYITLKAQEATKVSANLTSVQGEIASRIKSLEKAREIEKTALLKNIVLLYEACADSIQEIGNMKAHMSTNNPSSMDMRMNIRSTDPGEDFLSEEHIRALSERLIAAVKDLSNAELELLKADHLELKNTIANLQKEIQEKDLHKERICMEFVGQVKRAEAAATKYSHDLEVAAGQVYDLETRISAIEKDKNLLEQKMMEMEDEKTASVELQEKVRSMADMLSAKDQEIESLMQALDEEESELEDMSQKVEQMERELQQKNKEIGKLEHSHNKAMKKLSVTVSKFDELHDLSASLLTEVEKLQMQVQEKDKEISFLRQEITRCTDDILLASQSKHNSDAIIELFEWLKTATSQVDVMGAGPEDLKLNDAHLYKESIQNQIASVISELEDLRHVAGSRNEMLEVEKSKVQELMKKHEGLETALRQKEAQLNFLEEAPTSSGIGGIEPLENNWAVPGPSTSSQIRSLRKSNNDQVAIAIDDDPSISSRLEDEDEDKVHGFKSLTTSSIVPRFTRPVSDMIDGLWVSCDRALMRQPSLRLAIILYWALLHALLAAFVV